MATTDGRAAVVLAPGFEETEAVAVIDVLRRAGVSVAVAGLHGAGPVTGSHGLAVVADSALSSLRADELDVLVLPGGMPGSRNLARSPGLLDLLRAMVAGGRRVAAICAAPLALQAAGLLKGRQVTAYPGIERELGDVTYTGTDVQVDGPVITGKGPGTALRFGLEIVRAIGKPEKAAELATAMLVG
ncbi:MAG: Chaperone protein YajL [Lentisphaerae bacterium ADurb.BinA184]|nr:MAG: Chaperone protein YajL [Lentisphaerae bacterium ADurb.BinA184]